MRSKRLSPIATGLTRAAVYLRVSTDGQARTGLGLDAQAERCRAFATSKGWSVAATFRDEGVSGSVDFKDRPEAARLFEMIRAGEVDAVLVAKLDRLGRSTRDVLEMVEWLDELGVDFVSVEEGFDTSTSAGRFVMRILASVAELERDMGRDRTRAAMRQKRTRGEKTGGTVPYGFDVLEGGRLVPNAEEQKALVFIRRRHEEGASLRAIATELEARGIRTKTGRSTWAAETVSSILRRAEVAA